MNYITRLNILLRLTSPDTIFVLYAAFLLLTMRFISCLVEVQYEKDCSSLINVRNEEDSFNLINAR